MPEATDAPVTALAPGLTLDRDLICVGCESLKVQHAWIPDSVRAMPGMTKRFCAVMAYAGPVRAADAGASGGESDGEESRR
jgi:hypothetical protein